MKLGTFAATAACAALAATASQAQEASQDAARNRSGIEEVVVTAQRREQNLQEVGVAIDAVTSDDLEAQGVANATDLTRAVPAIAINNAGGQVTSIFLRGVGNITNNAYFDAAISPNLDSVVLGRPSGAFAAAFYDLARVEVLKGPQGILYGRNATGGAVNIVPNHPELGEFRSGVSASYGNFSALSAEGFVNVPLGERSALRFSGVRQKHDGYNRDGSADQDRYAFRAQYLVEPTDAFSLRVAGDFTNVGGVGAGASYLGSLRTTALTPATFDESEGLNTPAANAYRQTQLGAPGFGFLAPMAAPQAIDYDYWGVHAEAKLKTGVGEFTLIPAYRKTKGGTTFYGPGFNAAQFNEEYGQFTTELRLAGSAGMFDYVAGAFYFDENIRGNNNFPQEFVLPIQDYRAGTKSWAAFQQLTANVTERFRVIGGLRYTDDSKRLDGSQYTFVAFCGGSPPDAPPRSFAIGCAGVRANGQPNMPHFPSFLQPQTAHAWLVSNGYIPGTIPYAAGTQVYPIVAYNPPTGDPNDRSIILKTEQVVNQELGFNRFTWRVGTEFELAPQNLLYASVETGYRAGGVQIGGGRSTYKPEFITAYTVGSKNRFLDDRLQVNVEAFHWKYKDQQITYFSFSPTSGTVANTNENVGRSTIKGIDVDIVAKPFASTTVFGKVQFLDTEYQGLTLQTLVPRDNFNCPRTVTNIATPSGPVIQFDCSGKPLLQAPRWSVNVGVEQSFALPRGLELVAGANTAWRDDYWTNFNYLDYMKTPAYWTTNASLTLRGGKWSVGAFVDNIEDGRHLFQADASPIGFATGNYTPPRNYGVRVSVEF